MIGIIGLGQIGFSLALSLKEKNYRVKGVSRKKNVIEIAEKYIEASDNINSLKDCEIIFIATHLGEYEEIMKKIKFDGILSDVGSLKRHFVQLAKKYNFDFVGCHPIAGREKSGIESADKNLFNGKWCIISGYKNQNSFEKIKKIWEDIGSKVIVMSPEEHDKTFAFFSHLPHIISFLMVKMAQKEKTKIFGGSFEDIIRVAKSPPEMWADILYLNSDILTQKIEDVIQELKTIKKIINAKEKILNYILEAKKFFDTKNVLQ